MARAIILIISRTGFTGGRGGGGGAERGGVGRGGVGGGGGGGRRGGLRLLMQPVAMCGVSHAELYRNESPAIANAAIYNQTRLNSVWIVNKYYARKSCGRFFVFV